MTDANGMDIFSEWRTADRAAHDAEQRIARDVLASFEAHLPPPAADARDAAHRLRDLADDLFIVAMAELNRRADQLRH